MIGRRDPLSSLMSIQNEEEDSYKAASDFLGSLDSFTEFGALDDSVVFIFCLNELSKAIRFLSKSTCKTSAVERLPGDSFARMLNHMLIA